MNIKKVDKRLKPYFIDDKFDFDSYNRDYELGVLISQKHEGGIATEEQWNAFNLTSLAKPLQVGEYLLLPIADEDYSHIFNVYIIKNENISKEIKVEFV